MSCDNAAVTVSERNTRLATPADFGGAQQCTMLKNSVEGPFFFCTNPVTADIALGRSGAPLTVALRAIDAAISKPIPGAVIDIWHCDASGLYSGHNLSVSKQYSGSVMPVQSGRKANA